MFWNMMRKPLDLDHNLTLIFSYVLGTAVVFYGTGSVDWAVFGLGLLVVFSLSIVMRLVEQFFYTDSDLLSQLEESLHLNQARRSGDGFIIDRPRYLFLMLVAPFLALFFIAVIWLFKLGAMSTGALWILMLIALINGLAHKPPLHLADTKYRDIADGFATVALAPVFSNLLQYPAVIDLTTILTLSLLLLFFSLRIVLGLADFDEDIRLERKTMLVAFGWERGMQIHNIFLLLAYLVPAVALAFFSFPWEIFWPLLLNFGFVTLQVIQMIRIHDGAPVHWRLLRMNAYTTFYFFLYLAVIRLFIH